MGRCLNWRSRNHSDRQSHKLVLHFAKKNKNKKSHNKLLFCLKSFQTHFPCVVITLSGWGQPTKAESQWEEGSKGLVATAIYGSYKYIYVYLKNNLICISSATLCVFVCRQCLNWASGQYMVWPESPLGSPKVFCLLLTDQTSLRALHPIFT